MACEVAAKVLDIKDLLKRAAEKVGDSFHDADEGVHVDDHDAMAVAAPTSPNNNSPSKFRTSMISSPRNARSKAEKPKGGKPKAKGGKPKAKAKAKASTKTTRPEGEEETEPPAKRLGSSGAAAEAGPAEDEKTHGKKRRAETPVAEAGETPSSKRRLEKAAKAEAGGGAKPKGGKAADDENTDDGVVLAHGHADTAHDHETALKAAAGTLAG